ncbi:hypothetical protein MICPUN_62606 [Micromonas commoda]|uniref:Uncharacterized protein n=1 Tax=Micromonas commoda (strain RCC299 / NOUM17 / CCMP2709) TaxID=296587 RepID=C1EEF6_MICCC|nr:hypothetical protein MICPUN_62606 [Micromonas commoda]ACO66527.1 hypothetical protein MICPUN_62606 [Micromonas commoda]|eukprot:XP_002505269.1 hypothetical protein MICPUN_62606 [Micromonas commoda]
MSFAVASTATLVTATAARPERASTRGIAARNRVAASIAPRSVKVSARASRGFRVVAMAEKKPKILRENEKEAWLSEMEREGANPFKDPMAIVGILGITFPFVILAVAGAAGYIGQ